MIRSTGTRLIACVACFAALSTYAATATAQGRSSHRRAIQSKQAAASKAPPATPDSIAASPAFALQVALDRAGFSPGQIDARPGTVTRRALTAFQEAHGLQPTGEADEPTWSALGVEPGQSDSIVTKYSITTEDVKGPFTTDIPEDMVEKSKLPALGYTGVVEELAERFHVAPDLLKALNPNATFAENESIVVPQVSAPPSAPVSNRANAPAKAGGRGTGRGRQSQPAEVGTAGKDQGVTVSVSKGAEALTVRDASGKVIMFAPVTVGSDHDPLPIGHWKVTGVQRNPSFNYNPDLFWDADPSHTKAKIPPGPNNPVGVVWIDLDRPHYGLHGTPEPGKIAYRESHGCVRLTNWDAMKLASLVKPGTPVIFEP